MHTLSWRRALLIVAVVVVGQFAFRSLAVLDLTSLWNDELRSVEKAFQPSLPFVFAYLRSDVHPPLYYVLLWLAGQLFGQTVTVLRSFSWCAYLVGCSAVTYGVWSWRGSSVAATVAALLSISLPFTVRFAVEGKAYAVLFALIAMALAQRQRLQSARPAAGPLYAAAWAGAALTHYYGLGFLMAQTLMDVLRRQRQVLRWDGLALLLPGLWALSTIGFLLGQGGRDWIEPASPDLLRQTLALALGRHWPLVIVLALALVLLLLVRGPSSTDSDLLQLSRDWGLDAALLLTVVSVSVSIWKPSAVDRYFIVLVPTCVGVFSCWIGTQVRLEDLPRWRGILLACWLALILTLFWADAYRLVAPTPPVADRKGENFRAMSLASAETPLRLSPQCRQFRASDQVLVNVGLMTQPSRWQCFDADQPQTSLDGRLAELRSDQDLVVAIASRRLLKAGDLDRAVALVREAGWRCAPPQVFGRFSRLVRCRR